MRVKDIHRRMLFKKLKIQGTEEDVERKENGKQLKLKDVKSQQNNHTRPSKKRYISNYYTCNLCSPTCFKDMLFSK